MKTDNLVEQNQVRIWPAKAACSFSYINKKQETKSTSSIVSHQVKITNWKDRTNIPYCHDMNNCIELSFGGGAVLL